MIQETLRELKISVTADKKEKEMLACEISKVQQESLTAVSRRRNARSAWTAWILLDGKLSRKMAKERSLWIS